jgi:hypothetical protein
MTSAWIVVLGGLASWRTRTLFDRIGLGLLVAALGLIWIGGQAVALVWVTWGLVNGRLRLGILWLAGLLAWYYFFFRQIKWLFEEGYYSIRRRVTRRRGTTA